jgi:hypothetical protein
MDMKRRKENERQIRDKTSLLFGLEEWLKQ